MKNTATPATLSQRGRSRRTRQIALLAWMALTPGWVLAADIPANGEQETTPSAGDPAYGTQRDAHGGVRGGSEERGSSPIAAQFREPSAWKPTQTTDPLETYLARWMDPHDFVILVKGWTPGAQAKAGSHTESVTSDGGASPIMAAGLPKAGVPLDPENNPYLKAMAANVVPVKPTVLVTPSAPQSPTLKPPEVPAPKKTTVPPRSFGHPLRDKKEFPQLERF